MKFEISQIGTIHTQYKSKDECPVQGIAAPDVIGSIVIFPEYADGLMDIELFTHIILFYIFDRTGEISLRRKPFLDDLEHGIFATRHPGRPNGIGMSIVKLLNRNKNILEVGEIDVLDNTPLIDIKPYVPKFDFREGAGNGWMEMKEFRDKPLGRE
jgi:tRNA (adenine37-N6)-methyltransferase